MIHTGDTRTSGKGVIIDNLPLADFEDEWIQVETEMHYTHHGTFRIKLTRISDGKVLADQSFADVDLWRNGHKSVEINRHYSIQHKDSSKTKRVTFVKGGDALCQRKAKIYV